MTKSNNEEPLYYAPVPPNSPIRPEELDLLLKELDGLKEKLDITPGVIIPPKDEITLEIIKANPSKVISSILRKINSPHAGHFNNVGCAYLLFKEINCDDAKQYFKKASGAEDFPTKNGIAKSHAKKNLALCEQINDLMKKIKK